MFTLVDFITHVKGIEYILSITFIAGFLIFWEVLKPRPFLTIMNTGREDVAHIQKTGYGAVLKTAGKIAAAPFIGLAYLVMLPVGFAFVLSSELFNLALKGVNGALGIFGRTMPFEWRPLEAYFAGRKGKKNSDEVKQTVE